MNALLDFLVARWSPAALLGVAVAMLVALGLLRRRHIHWFKPLFVVTIALAMASIGGFILLPHWGRWLLISAVAVFIALSLLLAVSGAWWRWPAYAVAVLALLGAGGLWLNAVGAGIVEIFRDLRGLTFLHPW
jgi:hypothetical protein